MANSDEDTGDYIELRLVYGNTHRKANQLKQLGLKENHIWTVFVKFDDYKLAGIPDKLLVDKVRFGMLSGRFNNLVKKTSAMSLVTDQTQFKSVEHDYVDVKPNGTGIFERRAESWGTCSVPITIYLSAKTGLPPKKRLIELVHQISFDGKGKSKSINIKIDKDAAHKLGLKQ